MGEQVVAGGRAGSGERGFSKEMQLPGKYPTLVGPAATQTTFEERGIKKNNISAWRTDCMRETALVGGCSSEWARRRDL
jgi:hypothetical protein